MSNRAKREVTAADGGVFGFRFFFFYDIILFFVPSFRSYATRTQRVREKNHRPHSPTTLRPSLPTHTNTPRAVRPCTRIKRVCVTRFPRDFVRLFFPSFFVFVSYFPSFLFFFLSSASLKLRCVRIRKLPSPLAARAGIRRPRGVVVGVGEGKRVITTRARALRERI